MSKLTGKTKVPAIISIEYASHEGLDEKGKKQFCFESPRFSVVHPAVKVTCSQKKLKIEWSPQEVRLEDLAGGSSAHVMFAIANSFKREMTMLRMDVSFDSLSAMSIKPVSPTEKELVFTLTSPPQLFEGTKLTASTPPQWDKHPTRGSPLLLCTYHRFVVSSKKAMNDLEKIPQALATFRPEMAQLFKVECSKKAQFTKAPSSSSSAPSSSSSSTPSSSTPSSSSSSTTTTTTTKQIDPDHVEVVAQHLGGSFRRMKRKDVLSMTVSDLKDELRDRSLKLSGSKMDLIERLSLHFQGALPEEETKKRKKDTSSSSTAAPKSKKPKTERKKKEMCEGMHQNVLSFMNPKRFNTSVKKMVGEFHKMVDADWHDGYEEQEEYIEETFAPAVSKKAKLVAEHLFCTEFCDEQRPLALLMKCHEMIRAIADSLHFILSVPCRGSPDEGLAIRFLRKGWDIKSGSAFLWLLLLIWLVKRWERSENKTDEEVEFGLRVLKDANDFCDFKFKSQRREVFNQIERQKRREKVEAGEEESDDKSNYDDDERDSESDFELNICASWIKEELDHWNFERREKEKKEREEKGQKEGEGGKEEEGEGETKEGGEKGKGEDQKEEKEEKEEKEKETEKKKKAEEDPHLANVLKKVEEFITTRENEWTKLPSTKPRHATKRVIDRRFDGPKHLRTRCYDSDDSDDGGECLIC